MTHGHFSFTQNCPGHYVENRLKVEMEAGLEIVTAVQVSVNKMQRKHNIVQIEAAHGARNPFHCYAWRPRIFQ